jgi:hypothetical protein
MIAPPGYQPFDIHVPCGGVPIVADLGTRPLKCRAAIPGRVVGAPA